MSGVGSSNSHWKVKPIPVEIKISLTGCVAPNDVMLFRTCFSQYFSKWAFFDFAFLFLNLAWQFECKEIKSKLQNLCQQSFTEHEIWLKFTSKRKAKVAAKLLSTQRAKQFVFKSITCKWDVMKVNEQSIQTFFNL